MLFRIALQNVNAREITSKYDDEDVIVQGDWQMPQDKLTPSLLIEGYDKDIGVYDAFRSSVESVLSELVRLDGTRVHSITSRTKTRKSFSSKLTRDGKTAYGALRDVTDIVGIRIITHIEDEVDKVGQLIEREFVVDTANSIDKRQALDPDRFGYLSLHYVCTLNATRAGLAENKRFAGLKFEIQVRTILQHAWAEIEHDLGYKAGSMIPATIRRRFSRLAGLLEIADNEFMRLRDEINDYTTKVQEAIEVAPSSVDLDDVSLTQFIATNKRSQALDLQMAEFLDRTLEKKPVSRLASMLTYAGLRTIEDLSTALAKYSEAILVQFKERLKNEPKGAGTLGLGVSLFHLAQVMIFDRGGEKLLEKYYANFSIAGGKLSNKSVITALKKALGVTD